jgi:L-ribulose-5-phosphate 3-epimerase
MNPRLPIAAITDEFSPSLADSLPVMQEIGMHQAELRTIDGKNILDLSNDELQQAKDILDRFEMQVISIASPLLKCVLPEGGDLDQRFAHDAFASKHQFVDQPRLAERAIEIAHFFHANIIRVFSYWRVIEPERTTDGLARALSDLASLGKRESLVIGLENEHACNVATAAESARMLKLVANDALKLVWDPANAFVSGEVPFPDGYRLLPATRIVHVHAKDCDMRTGKPEWGPVGTRHIDWKGQIDALLRDGYGGSISLETHWRGPNGDKCEASRICGWNLRGLASA